MYAIIVDGGRQYKVEEGQDLVVDYRDVPAGKTISFENVVACSKDDKLQLGKPKVRGAKVTGTIVGVCQGPKISVQKFRRRKTFRRRTGHRQLQTKVKIDKIQLP